MDTTLLIIAIILTALSVAFGIVNIILSRKKGNAADNSTDVMGEIETLNNNLNEVKNLINDHTTKEKNNVTETITNSFNVFNNSIANMLETNIKNLKVTLDDSIKATRENLGEIRQEMKNSTTEMSKSTTEALEGLKKDIQLTLDKMSKTLEDSLDKINEELKQSLKEVREDNRSQLERVRDNNAAQLEKMRETVDEKLTSTLNSRIAGAFEVVNKSLENVQQGFGEMRDLTGKVSNLNKMFNNVKTRGGWGEVALESLLDQILSSEQYHRQFRLDKKSQEMVDFVIVMPGRGGERVYLPIDCKFPLDRYVELVNASEGGDADKIESARKDLVNQIKKEAKNISQKYIKLPITTPFAVMYLPSEGLYAEIAKDSALTTLIQNENNVTICGPTTITALLNSLQMGFTTLKIQKRSGEIAKALQQFQKDFKKYTDLVAKIKKNATTVVSTIDDVEKQNQLINKRLEKVGEELPQDSDEKLIASDIDETGEE